MKKLCRIPYLHDFPDYPCAVCSPKQHWAVTHGKTKTPEFSTWQNMKARCYNKKNIMYHRYGGRGIKVCKRWFKFENFWNDMGLKPSKDHSLDRINNNGDYSPQNCKWATKKDQARNRIQNVKYKGECAMDVSLKLSKNPRLVDKRIKLLGWSKKKAFTTPMKIFKGYSFKNNRYVVNLWINGSNKYCGSFLTEKEAQEKVKKIKG